MVTTAEELAQAVNPDAIRALLSARPVSLLTRPEMASLLALEVAGVATEVAAFAGAGPMQTIPANLWPLALRCVEVGVASSLESSAYPEQQLGDGNRADTLRTKFLALRADLMRLNPALAATAVGTSAYWSGMVGLT